MVAGLLGRKADAFAALLEGKQGAAADPQMSQLANIAQRLSTVPQPTAAFRSSLRDQLMATATQTAAPAAPHVATQAPPAHTPASSATQTPTVPTPRVSPHGLGSGHGLGSSLGSAGTTGGGLTSTFSSGLLSLGKTAPVWAKLFAGIAAVSVSATGVAVGAHRALPGDFFYGVKKQVEAVQLDLASGAHEKAITEFGFAQARINELNELIKRDHVVAGQPVSKETAAHIKDLLENWAENTGVATTSLIQQIQALGSSTATAEKSQALRDQLSSFTSQQFASVGQLLGSMPTSSLQSLTVSALGYLQRVDAVLGNDPASLIAKLPVSLNSVPGVSRVLPRLVLPSTIPTTGGKVVLPTPAVLNSLGGVLRSAPGALTSRLPAANLPSTGTGITLPSTGTGITLPTGGVLPSLTGTLPSITSIVPPLPAGIAQGTGLGALTGNFGSGGSGAVSSPAPGAVQSAVGAVQSLGGAVKSVGTGLTNPQPDAVKSFAGAVQSAAGAAASSGVGKTASGAVQGVSGAVTGAVGAVTGGLSSAVGPSLPLPTTLPVLPTLPKVPGLH